MATLAMVAGVHGQRLVKEMDGANTRFIPGAYMKNGEAAIYFSSDEYGYRDETTKYEAKIFDFELNLLKSFPFENLQPFTVTEYRETSGRKEITRVIDEFRGYFFPGVSTENMEQRKESFLQWFYEQNRYLDPTLTMEGLKANCRIEGTTILVNIPVGEFDFIQFSEYIKTRELYLNAEDKWGFELTYATTVPVCDGVWAKVTWYDVPVSNFCTPRCNDVANLNHWNGGVYLPFSQTFFNDDEKFEYVRLIADIAEGGTPGAFFNVENSDSNSNPLQYLFGITENDRDGDGVEDFRQTYYGLHCTGLEVVSEDGNAIYSFPLPNNCEGNATIEFYKSDNHILAQVEFNWYDESSNYKHTTRFYRLDKTSGTVNVIRDETHLAAYPNPALLGTPIRLDLSASNTNRTLSVFSLGGESLYEQNIPAGVTETYIPTHGLSQGMYLFSVYERGQKISASKIIIK